MPSKIFCHAFFPRLQLASDQKHFLANIIYKPTLALLGKGWGSSCASILRMRSHQSELEGPRRPCCSLPGFQTSYSQVQAILSSPPSGGDTISTSGGIVRTEDSFLVPIAKTEVV